MVAENIRQTVIDELDALDDASLSEVCDFVRFLKQRHAFAASESARLSESALKRDWDRPEEDQAWAEL